MLKMIKGHMETIDGVEIFPIISLLIFFLFFCGLFYRVFTASKGYITNMKELPLEPDTQQPNQNS
jgi:hypothetical protein